MELVRKNTICTIILGIDNYPMHPISTRHSIGSAVLVLKDHQCTYDELQIEFPQVPARSLPCSVVADSHENSSECQKASLSKMDTFPVDGDIYFPISPDSSAVDLLCSLQPPSSQLGFTWSSGDIPLVLYDEAYAEQPPVSNFECGNRGSIAALGTKTGNQHPPSPQRISIGSRAERDYDLEILNSSGSSETICSAATFGVRPRFSNAVEMPESSPITEGMPQSQSQNSPAIFKGLEKEENVLSGRLFSYGAIQQPTQNNLDVFRTHREWQRLNTGYFAPSRTSICERDFVEPPSSATDTPPIFERSLDRVLGSETPKKKAVSRISAHEWDYKQNMGIVTQEDSAQFPTQSQVAFDEPVHRPMSRSFSNAFENRSPGLKSVNVSLPHALEVIQDHHQTPSPNRRISLSPFSSPYEEDFPWLKDITVQFLIDQEGFRDAEPCFKFSGILRVRSASQTRKPEKLMAQFRPVSRQHFHFHHAPLESPPVLRRITVNSDESSDYVSKQAHLTLKLNGVFVVQGHEMSLAEHNSESSKLCWQFEYLVDNRRIDISGSSRDLEGEKTLTPLTFSCSPELLLPSQAKRINIMHVFKKSVAPKIVAEKLQPPASTRVTAGSMLGININCPSTLSESTFSLKNEHSYGHLRRLDGFREPDDHVHSTKRIVGGRIPSHDAIHKGISMDNTGHRQASLADKRSSLLRINPNLNSTLLPVTDSAATRRHIVPPDRLSELLDFPLTENGFLTLERSSYRLSTMTMTSDRNSKEFIALSPRPKYAYQAS